MIDGYSEILEPLQNKYNIPIFCNRINFDVLAVKLDYGIHIYIYDTTSNKYDVEDYIPYRRFWVSKQYPDIILTSEELIRAISLTIDNLNESILCSELEKI